MAGIPHGRGERRGPDAYINQMESRNARARGMPVNDGLFVSTLDPYSADVTTLTSDGSASTWNKFAHYLFAFPPLVSGVDIFKARFRMTVAPSVNRFVRFGVYRFDSEHGKKAFRVVPGTRFTFDAGTAGVLERKLKNPVTLRKGSQYYLGINVGLGVGLACVQNPATRLVPAFYDANAMASATGPLPAKVPLSNYSKEYAVNVPWVMYLSKTGDEIM